MAWNPQEQNKMNPSPMNTNPGMNHPQQANIPHNQQQHQMNPTPMNMNMRMNMNMNAQQQLNAQQQTFPMYPPYPMNTSPMMYNQNYPMQPSYTSPFNNNPPFQPYFGLQPMQSQQMISPFQQQRNMNNTQPLPQQFHFNSNNHQTQQTQQRQPKQEEEEEKKIINQQDAIMHMDDNDNQPKSRLAYSKASMIAPKQPWLLTGKETIDVNNQLMEENKIFGDLQTVYNEMKQNNSGQIDGNTQKQNCRLFLQYKAKKKKDDDDDDDEKQLESSNNRLQPLLVYEYNIRPYYEPFNEYKRYKLLRLPPISSYPSNPPITATLYIYSVQFKDLSHFTIEDYLTQQIIFDHKTYTKCLLNHKSFKTNITLLRTRIEQLIKNKKNNLLCIQLLDELITTRQKKDELQLEIKQLFTKIYMNWRNLVSWRYNNGPYKFANHSSLISSTASSTTIYQGTKLMLYLKKIEPNRIKQQIEYKQAVNDELYDIKNLIKLKNIIHKQQERSEEVFDEKRIKDNIIQRQNTYLMKPGTVYYIAYIDTNACNISQTDLCNTRERFRRRQLTNYALSAHIKVNNYQNTKIKTTKITRTDKIYTQFPSFVCDLQLELEMKMLQEPQSIDIELKLNSWFSSKSITNINIPINTNLIKQQAEKLNKHESTFESEITISENRYLSNEDYKTYIFPTNNDWNRRISGCISYGLKLETTDQYKSNQILTVNVISDKEKEKETETENKERSEDKTEEELLLIDSDANHETFRQKILKLRRRYVISDAEHVALFDKDIGDNLYAAVYDDTKQEIAYRNEIILDRINNATIDVSEVVREEKIDFFPCFSFSIYSLFKPRRKLRPKKSYLLSSKASINPEKCKIILQVLQCKNLPIRKQSNIVEPFIEITFMGNKCKTFTSFGLNARWEQTLEIEFIPPGNHKYTPSNLQKINHDIEINIYDELIVSIPYTKKDDRVSADSQIQRKEKRYLGTIKIPFATLYFNKNIEGFFKLNVPLILLGYTKNINEATLLSLFITLDPPILSPYDEFNENIYYEWILLNNNDSNDSNDSNDKDFYLYCIEWMKSIVINGKQIELQIFSSNSRNEAELICRYLRSIEPPMQITPELFIRFVSCIPYSQDIHLIPGARDIWMTNGDFLKLGSGDCEEHANLLACYFMWYDAQNPNSGWSTFIALGKGIPDGNNTMYVLRRNSILKHSGNISIQNIMLYDASNGISYNIPEVTGNIPACNLYHISIVYNSHQIYANLQSPDIHPSSQLFNYEFENKQLWKPLFNDTNINYIPASLQEPILEYKSLPNEYYIKRQNKLEYIIEKQFDSWRKLPTKWNYAICKTLREILVGLEPLCQNGGHNNHIINQDPLTHSPINQIYSKIYGFPLNVKDNGSNNLMLENNQNNAVSLVYNTKVHQNDDPNVEFARAVYVYPYTNKIASVWIYIASLSKH